MWSGFSFFGSRPLDGPPGPTHKQATHRPESSELFVGGIPCDTTIKELKAYFSEFGQIEECRMKEDKLTNKFRGFGFIKFKDPRSVQLVMAKKHQIRGSPLDVKKAITKEENERHVNDELLRKIFLAHINSKLTEFDLYKYFKKFDEIESLNLKREGGYGFLLFKSRIGPVKVFEAGEIHSVKGFKLECRKVLTRDNLRSQTVTSNQPAKAKLAKADDPHLKAVNALMDDGYDSEFISETRPRGSEINLSQLDQLCNVTSGDPKASVMDTTTGSSKLPKKLKYSGQVFEFPNDETFDMTSKPNDTTLQETSFLDRSQVPVRIDRNEMVHYGSILNEVLFAETQEAPQALCNSQHQEVDDSKYQCLKKSPFGETQVLTTQVAKQGLANTSRKKSSEEDEADTLLWQGMEYAIGPIDTKALEVAVQKLNLQSRGPGTD